MWRRECRVQDVDVNGTPIEELSKSRQATEAVSLLIKIGHKVPLPRVLLSHVDLCLLLHEWNAATTVIVHSGSVLC